MLRYPRPPKHAVHEIHDQRKGQAEVRELCLEARPRPPLDQHVDVVGHVREAQGVLRRQENEGERPYVCDDADHGLGGRQGALVREARRPAERAAPAAGGHLAVLRAGRPVASGAGVGEQVDLAAEAVRDGVLILHERLATRQRALGLVRRGLQAELLHGVQVPQRYAAVQPREARVQGGDCSEQHRADSEERRRGRSHGVEMVRWYGAHGPPQTQRPSRVQHGLGGVGAEKQPHPAPPAAHAAVERELPR
mmetsp:Transcript_110668/g.313084  ORF Transcript_110668/g.313084 Transcript_110668/m.313084 type:complete len:251 (+) Transcript_110668:1223-1975(+)